MQKKKIFKALWWFVGRKVSRQVSGFWSTKEGFPHFYYGEGRVQQEADFGSQTRFYSLGVYIFLALVIFHQICFLK